jgi:hypothetical protein
MFATALLIGFPAYQIWRYTQNAAHDAFFGTRRAEFTAQQVTFYGERGASTSYYWGQVAHVWRTENYYLFFLDGLLQFQYVPFEALQPEDRNKIDLFLKNRGFIQ